MTWAIERRGEDAATFHARPMPDPVERAVWRCDPTGAALVLGSAQSADVVDHEACDAAGVAVARRRSGGGAVLVEPGALLWVDVLLPARDALWDDDVGRAFLWLGDLWADALAAVGVASEVHRGPLRRSRWSDLACFAGLGPGELTDASGRKVVGISQRRNRVGARFQCAVLGSWDPSALVALLSLTPAERETAEFDLLTAAAPAGPDLDSLFEAFVLRLP